MTVSPTIRRARPDDANRLTDIALASKRHWGYPETWIVAWRHDLTITPEFIGAHLVCLAADHGDVPVAFYALVRDRTDTHLEHLWVDPAHIGRGLGRALFAHAVRAARATGAAALVIESDPNAEAFYRRMGAETVGSRRADVCAEYRTLPILRLDLQATPRRRGRP